MTKIKTPWVMLAVCLVAATAWLNWPEQNTAPVVEENLPSGLALGVEPILPLAPPVVAVPGRARLGEALFSDTRLSGDGTVSCASCHDLELGGMDRRDVSLGVGGARGSINAPTVFNSGLNFVQFWDGRAATLEEQAAGPIHNPVEMASGWPEVVARLEKDADYARQFGELYPDGLTPANIANAIAEFERTLVTTGARFDRYLLGDGQALSSQELEGYRRFKDYGCASCHQGVNVGGNMFQRFGVMGDYFARRQVSKPDLGRYNVTGQEEDRHVFKVPSLRNVALTAPYFHDASAATLDEAVSVMARFQLGRELSADDIDAITAFLRSLTGQWRGQALK